jgi:hypothetical protein
MSKYAMGVWFVGVSVAVMVGYNVNIVSGIASLFTVWGIAYMITGTIEGTLKAIFNAMREMKK